MQIPGLIAPYREIGVSAALSEPLLDVDVREGDIVHAGQALAHLETDDLQAQLVASERVIAENRAHLSQTAYSASAVTVQDTTSIRSARASLAQANVALTGALADLRRYESLVTQGYLPEQTVDQQRTTVSSDRQAVSAAQATVDAAQGSAAANGNGRAAGAQHDQIVAAQAAVDSAIASTVQLQRQIARATIVAPMDGIVEAVNANPGEYPSGRQLFTLEDSAHVYALLPASSAQAVTITRGAAASITTSGPRGWHGSGVVDAVLDQLQPGTTNFTVKVLVANPQGRLHAGMPIRGVVNLPRLAGIAIPSSAFVDEDRTSVYIVRDATVHEVPVAEIGSAGSQSIVTGVDPGTRVIQNAQATTVADGDRIRF